MAASLMFCTLLCCSLAASQLSDETLLAHLAETAPPALQPMNLQQLLFPATAPPSSPWVVEKQASGSKSAFSVPEQLPRLSLQQPPHSGLLASIKKAESLEPAGRGSGAANQSTVRFVKPGIADDVDTESKKPEVTPTPTPTPTPDFEFKRLEEEELARKRTLEAQKAREEQRRVQEEAEMKRQEEMRRRLASLRLRPSPSPSPKPGAKGALSEEELRRRQERAKRKEREAMKDAEEQAMKKCAEEELRKSKDEEAQKKDEEEFKRAKTKSEEMRKKLKEAEDDARRIEDRVKDAKDRKNAADKDGDSARRRAEEAQIRRMIEEERERAAIEASKKAEESRRALEAKYGAPCFELPTKDGSTEVETLAADMEVHWGYDDGPIFGVGPKRWNQLDPANEACANGKRQSPIDLSDVMLETSEQEKLPTLTTNFSSGNSLMVINMGHTIKMLYDEGNFVTLWDSSRQPTIYEVQEVVFHTPSEHSIAGEQFPMEVQLMCSRTNQTHPVDDAEWIGIFAFVQSTPSQELTNRFLSQFWKKLPRKKNTAVVDKTMKLDLDELLPKDITYYSAANGLRVGHPFYYYEGSLTTPPCTEGVKWFGWPIPIDMWSKQSECLETLVQQSDFDGEVSNARPQQPLNDRQPQYRTNM